MRPIQLPEGTLVLVMHGRKWMGPYQVQSVSDAWWPDPGRLWLKNLKTGKFRAAGTCQVALYTEIEQRQC